VDADGYYGGFVQDYALVADIDEGVGGSQVDREIVGEHASELS
jgi:hypothetical protein